MSQETAQLIACTVCGAPWPATMRTCPADGAPLSGAASEIDAPLAAGTQVGEYRIEDLLGAGGMGEVYRARHPVIDKRVAIKIMSHACSSNPINVERFVQEAKAVNAIGHANIVDIFSFGRHEGRCFFVMEWLRGESLRQRLDSTVLAPHRIYDILDAVLRALEAAHSAGVIHRDLKPDNIFLTSPRDDEAERVKLLDFGIAKLSDERDGTRPRGSKTQTGTVVGTPAYMSPEQAGGGVIEPASDIYSLGVVAYEMAAGRVPFDAESTVQIMAAHVCEPPPPPSTYRDLDADFEELILGMLHKQPDARPSPAEVRGALARLRGRPTTAPVIAEAEPAHAPRRPTPRSDAHAATALAPATPVPGSLRLSSQLTVPERKTPNRALQSASIPVVSPKLQIKFEPPPGTGVVAPTKRPYGVTLAIAAVVLLGVVWFATRDTDDEIVAPTVAATIAAPAPPPPRASAGLLAIDVAPIDAVVAIDGTNQVLDGGKLERRIAVGSYAITVTRDGYRTATTTLVVNADTTARWSTTLVEEPAKPTPPVAQKLTVKPVKPVKPTKPPPTKPPTSPTRSDVDAVRDPFAPGGSP